MRPGLFLSTDLVAPNLRNDLWREITRPVFETSPLGLDGQGVLEGSLTSHAIGRLLIGPATFNAQRYTRDHGVILRSGLDHYLLQLFVRGALEGDCDGAAVKVAPGDLCVLDLARRFIGAVQAGSMVFAIVPRERIDRATGGRSLHGVVLRAQDPVTRLLADFIVSLSDAAAEMSEADALAMEDAALSLIATGLAHRGLEPSANAPGAARVLRRRVLEFIDANLFEPALGPDLLMARFQVSRAHLYRMFTADGGVARIVRDRRLDAAYREFILRGDQKRALTETAYGLGFSSSAQFTRAFRARFAMTPSQARQSGSALRPTGLQVADLQAHFARHSQPDAP